MSLKHPALERPRRTGTGLRLQIVLALAGAILIAYVPLFFAIAQMTRGTVLGFREDAARSLGRAIAAHIVSVHELAPSALERTVGTHIGESGAVAIAIFGPDGRARLMQGPPAETALLEAPLRPYGEVTTRARAAGGRAMDIALPLGTDSAVVVRVRAEDDRAVAAHIVRAIALYMFLFALGLLVFAYIVLTRTVVLPVEELARAMTSRLRSEEQALRNKVEELTATTKRLSETRLQLAGSEHLANIGKLAAGVAHEIGNPIAAILGMHDLLDDEATEPEVRADFLRRMRKETERIHFVLRDLLAYARPTSDQDSVRILVGEVLDDALNLVRPQKDFRLVGIHVEVEPEIAVEMSPQRLTQVLLNVLLNAGAALAGASSEHERHLTVRAKGFGELVRIEVEDNGPGIPAELAPRIFEPFVTSKVAGAGTGLGLAVCRSIIEAARGRIFLDTAHDRGAKFVIELPRA